MELSIEDPFSEVSCDTPEDHRPQWKPYPKRLNADDMRFGMVTCRTCGELMDYGVTKVLARG